MSSPLSFAELSADLDALRWQIAMGADEALGEGPSALSLVSNRAVTPPLAQTSAAPRPSILAQLETVPVAPPVAKLARPVAPSVDLAKITRLEDLRAALEHIHTLGIKDTAMNLVFGEGALQPPVMLIGEAPGEEEDRTGRPFVGRAGQLLEKMLAAIGYTREQLYISNVLPWRPPGNRTPKAEEVATCLPYLMRHIELVQPKFLLLLGASSAKAVLGKDESVSRLRGHWHSYHSAGLPDSIPALVSYHPAYLLRTPAQKRESWRDLRLLKNKIDSL